MAGFLERVAPRFVLSREKARAELAAVRAHRKVLEQRLGYEGAGRGRRHAGWMRVGDSSANQAARGALHVLRERSRELVRNNAHAKTAVGVLESEIVGHGIRPQAMLKGEDSDAARAIEEHYQSLWEEWAETEACDAGGRLDFYGIQALVVRETVEAGECLVRRRTRRASDGLPLPMQLQVLEPDYLDSSKDEVSLPNGGQIIHGVEFDALDRRVAYWLYPNHPGDSPFGRAAESKRVPADQVAHHFRGDRAGQVRGIPWGAPVILRLRDWEDYQDAQLLRQKIAACYAGFEHDLDAEISVSTGQGSDANAQPDPIDSIEPGTIEKLPPGRSIEFSKPPGVDGIQEYARVSLREIAKGYDVTYEALTGDLATVNFSSGRMGRLGFQRDLGKWRRYMTVPQLCRPAWRWFLDAAELAGRARPMRPQAVWTSPPPEFLDPRVEVKAKREEVRSGLLTLDEAIRQRGFEPRAFLAQYARNNALLDELEIILDTDPRQSAQPGSGGSGSNASAAELEEEIELLEAQLDELLANRDRDGA